MEPSINIAHIIERFARDDDQAAFKVFFDHYYPRLIKYALYVLESQANAEDVVANAFVKWWTGRKKLLLVNRVEPYLFTALKHDCYNFLRDNKQHFMVAHQEEHSQHSIENGHPEQLMMDQEINLVVASAINLLPPRCKMVFELVRNDGLKYAEVAQLMDVSVKTVDTQMARAVAKIREAINSYQSVNNSQSNSIKIAK
ncbi:RNA polymerase sigma-70 factor [Marinoscillum furvescens]|uniref:RNA polymerase sigma-70 factor (ECF subfamily) n=1 Tax=Marinoscillum furvescens DSM 4134 TaxID=1122208 RepID=A0A3D9KXA0_MARFU|nr:RNA polymerase sigma-70 factor [Marinoscillum furvescens]RED93013.1 RNA polymerase sigma-70 factor (ECF subfamily) [Marinoscillum furvescens DSM 4134]